MRLRIHLDAHFLRRGDEFYCNVIKLLATLDLHAIKKNEDLVEHCCFIVLIEQRQYIFARRYVRSFNVEVSFCAECIKEEKSLRMQEKYLKMMLLESIYRGTC